MDTLTHTLIGACLGEAIAGKKLGKKAMLLGTLANNFPDIDVVSTFWTSETQSLLTHRGITHSILFNIICTILISALFKKYSKNDSVSFKQWLLLFGSGFFIHFLIDAFTAYGTGWFEPFDHSRVSFNAIFILDPFFMLPVLIATIALLILKRDSFKRKKWCQIGLSISLFYLVLTIVNKLKVDKVVSENIETQHLNCDNYMATPTALNNFLWYVIISSGDEYRLGYYSLFDRNKTISFKTIQRNDSLLIPFRDTYQLKNLKRFSKGFYSAKLKNDTIIFSDMRFGQLGGWYKEDQSFVFNFKLAKNYNNRTVLQRGRFESFDKDVLNQLFKRIKGN